MNNMLEELSIVKIDGGDAIQKIDYQLGQAVLNCLDPNAVAKVKRKVKITISLTPTNDRKNAELEYKVETVFPGDAPGVDTVAISRAKKKGFVSSQQLDIDATLGLGEEVIDEDTGEVSRIVPKTN